MTLCLSTLRSKKAGKQKRKNEEEEERKERVGGKEEFGDGWEVRGGWAGHEENQGMTAVYREERDRVRKWSELSVVFFLLG